MHNRITALRSHALMCHDTLVTVKSSKPNNKSWYIYDDAINWTWKRVREHLKNDICYSEVQAQ